MSEQPPTHECMTCKTRLPTCTHKFTSYDYGQQEWCPKCGAFQRTYPGEKPKLPLTYVYCAQCVRIDR
jgi:hypothetical protein